jgi:hypothetical protein
MKDDDSKQGKDHLEELADWKENYQEGEGDPKEQFRQISHIALTMSYDLIDKVRWWEKHTLELTDEEVGKRIPHMAEFLDRLRVAYLEFADVDL